MAELLEKGVFVLTPARITAYQMLLTFSDITIQRCTSNLADYVPLGHEGEPHDCVGQAMVFSKLRADLQSEPLIDEDKKVLFVDGSCYRGSSWKSCNIYSGATGPNRVSDHQVRGVSTAMFSPAGGD